MALTRDEWLQTLRFIKGSRESTYRIVTLKLDSARTRVEFNITGSSIWVLTATDTTCAITLQLNETENDEFTLTGKQKGVRGIFHRFFVTNSAQASKTVTLAIATQLTDYFEPLDTSSQVEILTVLEAIRDELLGSSTGTYDTEKTVGNAATVAVLAANTTRKAFMVQAKAANTGVIYIGFDNTVSATKWVAQLQAGQSLLLDDYRGAIHAIASAAGQLLGFGEW